MKQEEMGKHVGKLEWDENCKTLIGKINGKRGWVDMLTLIWILNNKYMDQIQWTQYSAQ
jgi:hypothetical protein